MRPHSLFLFIVAALMTSNASTAGSGQQQLARVPQDASIDAAASFHEPWTWERLIAQLRSSNFIGTDATDYPGSRLPFFRAVVDLGNQARFEQMLKDECPAMRCAGLQGLAKTRGRASAAVLREHLSDRGLAVYMWDDIGGFLTVGHCAMMLLHDPNLLVSKVPPYMRSPLLPENELIALEIEALATDGAAAIHDQAADDLDRALKMGRLTLDIPALRRMSPSLKDYQIIKAIGRLKASPLQRDFLLVCLHRRELDSNARLAAASALTRHADEASFQALKTERKSLDQTDDRRWGSRLMEAARLRRALGRSVQFTRGRLSWEERERIRERIVLELQPNHPLVYDELVDPRDGIVMGDRPEMRQALGRSLIAISKNLGEVDQSWNTYSNTAFKLDGLTRLIRLFREGERQWIQRRAETDASSIPERLCLLTENECTQIEQNITEFLK